MFSGFFTSSNFVTSILGNELAYKIHVTYVPFVFAILVYVHSLTGFYLMVARNKKFDTLTIKTIFTIVWTVMIIGFSILFFGQFSSSSDAKSTTSSSTTNSQTTSSTNQQNNQTTVKTYTLSEVAKHSSEIDCWMIISGKIYDITDYFGQHPGGDRTMTPYCGKDGTTAYETKDKARAQDHSAYADQLLEKYYVGDLK